MSSKILEIDMISNPSNSIKSIKDIWTNSVQYPKQVNIISTSRVQEIRKPSRDYFCQKEHSDS